MQTDSDSHRSFPPFGAILRAAPRGWWLVLILVALIELIGHVAIRSRVPRLKDWRAASAFVRAQLGPRDAVTVAPAWADPILRWFLGESISLSLAGRSDLAAYDRLWALSIRDHQPDEAPLDKPDLVRQFGRVKIFRWKLPPSPVLYDLVENVTSAQVAIFERGRPRPCPFTTTAPGAGGGLGKGALAPATRAICDSARRWLWVAPVIMEDLDLKPRRCVWHHPAGDEPIRVTYRGVPLGARVVFYGGLYYEHERMREGGPVEVSIRVNGERAASMVHRDGDGWTKLTVPTGKAGASQQTGEIVVEVSAHDPRRRGFCWAATVRRDDPERAP